MTSAAPVQPDQRLAAKGNDLDGVYDGPHQAKLPADRKVLDPVFTWSLTASLVRSNFC